LIYGYQTGIIIKNFTIFNVIFGMQT
jgi:hypothetical protein